jgi:DNA primase
MVKGAAFFAQKAAHPDNRGAPFVRSRKTIEMVIQQIKDQLNIVEYIGRHIALKKTGSTHKAHCPFHKDDTPSFHVDPARQSWRCFGACSTGGDIFAFAMKYHGWTFRRALEELARLANVELPERAALRRKETEALRNALTGAVAFFTRALESGQGTAARQYLAERGLSETTIRAFSLGYAPDTWDALIKSPDTSIYKLDTLREAGLTARSEKTRRLYDVFRNRLMFPIRDQADSVVGFAGRAMDNDRAKYINSAASAVFDKSALLYGYGMARPYIAVTKTIVLVEGYFDVISAHQHGFLNVVGQMGTALSDKQVRLIVGSGARSVVLAYDNDAAGAAATERAVHALANTGIPLRVAQYDAKDPDELLRTDPDQFGHAIFNAQQVVEWIIDRTVKAVPENASVTERETAARMAFPLLRAFDGDAIRMNAVQAIAMRLRLNERALVALAQHDVLPNALYSTPSVSTAVHDVFSAPIAVAEVEDADDWLLIAAFYEPDEQTARDLVRRYLQIAF